MATLAPPETKTVSQTAVTIFVGALTWILVSYVPAFHSGLPGPLAGFLDWFVAALLGGAAGYFAKHTPRTEDVVRQAATIIHQIEDEHRAIVPGPDRAASPSGLTVASTASATWHQPAPELPKPVARGL
jgi:hypothetical protein